MLLNKEKWFNALALNHFFGSPKTPDFDILKKMFYCEILVPKHTRSC